MREYHWNPGASLSEIWDCSVYAGPVVINFAVPSGPWGKLGINLGLLCISGKYPISLLFHPDFREIFFSRHRTEEVKGVSNMTPYIFGWFKVGNFTSSTSWTSATPRFSYTSFIRVVNSSAKYFVGDTWRLGAVKKLYMSPR